MAKTRRYIGLDFGASGVKAAVVCRKGTELSLESLHFLDPQAEGILNEGEFYASVSEWVQRNGWKTLPAAIALPQYLVSCTEKDFPECPPDKLPELVAFETRQVAGLSDETMAYGYVPLPAGLDRKNPVLIGIGREQLIRERLELYERNGIRCDNLGLGGVAVVNAFYALKPDMLGQSAPVLLVDIGKENATAVVLSGGQPLFVGSLMFAGDKFEAACRERGVLGPKSLEEVVLTEEIGHSQLLTVATYLEDEIHGALETWRAQENGDTARLVVGRVFLCGGISRMRGLCAWLTERLETPVEVIGPVLDGVCHPEQMVAYGMALQAAESASVPLSLLPADYRSRMIRNRLWPFLAAGIAVVALALLAVESHWYTRMDAIEDLYQEEVANLESCTTMIEDIKKTRATLYDSEARLVPFIAPGNQLGNLMAALTALGKSTKSKSWIIYFGDEASYLGKRGLEPEMTDAASGASRPAGIFGGAASDTWTVRKTDEFRVAMSPKEVVPVDRLVVCGYYAVEPQDNYKVVTDLRAELNASGLFSNVDTMPRQMSDERQNDVFAPWESFMRQFRNYRQYTFVLPLKDNGIHTSVVSEYVDEQVRLKTKGRKKK